MDHADKALPEVSVTLGEKTYSISCTLGVLNRFEKQTGKNSMEDATWEKPTSQDLTALLWAAVNFQDPTVTYDHVEKHVRFKDLKVVGQIVRELFRQSAPVSDEADEKKAEGVSQETTAK